MRTFCPFRMFPFRREYSEHPPPQGMAAASSKVRLAGLIARGPPSSTHVYSAYVLVPPPKTLSPTLNRLTSFPTASTSPARSDPSMGFLGLDRKSTRLNSSHGYNS